MHFLPMLKSTIRLILLEPVTFMSFTVQSIGSCSSNVDGRTSSVMEGWPAVLNCFSQIKEDFLSKSLRHKSISIMIPFEKSCFIVAFGYKTSGRANPPSIEEKG
jgi:hypothetical protein